MRRMIFMAALAVLSFGSSTLRAQGWKMPPDSERCPSKWGAADQRQKHRTAFEMPPEQHKGGDHGQHGNQALFVVHAFLTFRA